MELSGTVLNVVDFGAFVDIGLHDTGLVHISQLANKYVRDPHEVVSVGDTVKVWVHEIDKTRRRVSLTMIAPGTPRGNERRARPKRGDKPAEQPSGPGNGTPGAEAESAPPSGGERRGPPRERSGQGGSHSRPPRRDSAPAGRGHGQGQPPRPKFKSGPPKKPKPLIPITSAMKEGREPLRTFGDLKQFLELKTPDAAGRHGALRKPRLRNSAAEHNAAVHTPNRCQDSPSQDAAAQPAEPEQTPGEPSAG